MAVLSEHDRASASTAMLAEPVQKQHMLTGIFGVSVDIQPPQLTQLSQQKYFSSSIPTPTPGVLPALLYQPGIIFSTSLYAIAFQCRLNLYH